MTAPHKYANLDGLRGLAAIIVMALHIRFVPGAEEGLSSGYLAVDLFFILSGFVIAHAYSARLDAGMTARRFILMRLIRLYPLYFAGLILGAAWRVSELLLHRPDALPSADIATSFILGLAFLPGPSGGMSTDAWPLNVVFWSLFFELVVNFAAALAWRRLRGALLPVVIATGAVALIFIAASAGSVEQGARLDDLWGGLARAVFSFFAGIGLYRLRDRIAFNTPPMLALAVVAVFLLMPAPAEVRPVYDLLALFAVFPLVVATAQGSPGPRLTRTFEVLGAASYAIYTLHRPLAGLVEKAQHALDLPQAAVAIPFMVGMLIVALVADRFYDAPVRRWLTSRLIPSSSANHDISRRGRVSAADAQTKKAAP